MDEVAPDPRRRRRRTLRVEIQRTKELFDMLCGYCESIYAHIADVRATHELIEGRRELFAPISDGPNIAAALPVQAERTEHILAVGNGE